MILFIKHIDIEGPGTLQDFFKQTSWQTKIIELQNHQTLPSIDECEAIISLGGPINVYEEDKYSFLKDEDGFLRKALKEEIPVLGICLGAQLLAKACRANVKRAQTKEIGWHSVNLTDAGRRDLLFEGLPAQLAAFQWHEDTFDIPNQGLLLASSASCGNQAFRFGSSAYGLQFHIEVTPEMVESWINKYKDEGLSETDRQKMLIEANKRKEDYERQANFIYLNFSRIIKLSQQTCAA